MSLSRIYAIFLRQYYLIRGNPTRLFGYFVWLTLSIIQWGFITKYLKTLNQGTFNFVNVLLGAIIIWEVFNRMQTGVLMSFLEDIWSQNFFNYFASPLKISEYLAGLILTSIGMGTIGMLILISIAGFGFGYNFFQLGLMILPFVVVLLIFGMAMGVLTAAMIFRLGPAAEWLGWPLPFFLSIFSGVFYPIAALPISLQWFAKLLPPAYIFESLRTLIFTGKLSADLIFSLLAGAVLAIIYFLAAYGFFVRVYRHNLRTGMLARFGSEIG